MKTPAEQGLGHASAQIRLRLRPEERFAYEQLRAQARQAGKPEAETLSSWVRYQLRPLTNAPANRERCEISAQLYEALSQLAGKIGMEPETFIEACIPVILDMADHPKRKLPLFINKCRKALSKKVP